ncbi:MAG TPA: lmo0937 family membrane protein [Bryobacteraceae bacterium]|nr:lmo0937 family membrane protein [Bryobacteraceae bacterium]
MLWKIAAVLFILWIFGFALHVAGALIHLVLVIAVVMFAIHLFSSRAGTA